MSADVRTSAAAEILVVDDDAPFVSFLADVLLSAGFRATAVSTGEEAPARAGVLLGVRLPRTSGYEVCRELRVLHGPGLPVIFVSGERRESFDKVAGLLIGADDYLTKPLAPDELLVRLRSLLRRAVAPV